MRDEVTKARDSMIASYTAGYDKGVSDQNRANARE